jgi:hypothetical protein
MAFRRGFGIGHFKIIEHIKDNSGNYQPGIVFIIGGNDVPRGVMSAGRLQTILVSLHVVVPIFPLVNVSQAEFPVLVLFVDALKESLSLFALRQVEKKT